MSITSVNETPPARSQDTRWEAVLRRDPEADGRFFYAVLTTGVYCHPSCAARTPLRDNVSFHETREAAERAGFRPCKRCRPDLPPRREREAALVAEVCRALDSAEEQSRLDVLAAGHGLSVRHLHRVFRRVTGVTPRAYTAARRQGRVQAYLAAGDSVTEAIYGAGFGSAGRFYEAALAMLGMAPSIYRKGGAGETLGYAVGPCALGQVLVAATARGVCAILLGDSPAGLRTELERRFPGATRSEAGPEVQAWLQTVIRLVDDPLEAPGSELPLDIRGTAFQRRVWEALRGIPPGSTASYAEIAERIGRPGAARAVAGACAANPLAVAIPCHRVVPAGGGVGGYRWGVERKRTLLDREHQ